MDLCFSRFEADTHVTARPPDLAVLMVGVAARQAASPTALIHARLPVGDGRRHRYAPLYGAFSQATWVMLGAARQVMKPPFTEPL